MQSSNIRSYRVDAVSKLSGFDEFYGAENMPNVEDVEIGMDTVIHPNTTIKSGVVIGEDCNIGPNAYIREGCKLADKVKVGSFVEIKKAQTNAKIEKSTNKG